MAKSRCDMNFAAASSEDLNTTYTGVSSREIPSDGACLADFVGRKRLKADMMG